MGQNKNVDNSGAALENSDKIKLCIDVAGFASLLAELTAALNKTAKRQLVQKIINDFEWQQHYANRRLGTKVLSEDGKVAYTHENETAIKLADLGYYVVFVHKGLFKRDQKRYDIILLNGHNKIEADLKCVTSTNVNTIAKRIRNGSEQANRVVLDVRSDIATRDLIQALRSGSFRNDLLIEVWVFHKKRFYIMPKNLIISNRIYEILK